MNRIIVIVMFLVAAKRMPAQSHAAEMAEAVMAIRNDSLQIAKGHAKLSLSQGILLKGIEGLWLRTGDKKYFDYIQNSIDFFVDKTDSIRTYIDSGNLNNMGVGRNLLMLYKVLGREKYYQAARQLHMQLMKSPYTLEDSSGFNRDAGDLSWAEQSYVSSSFNADWSKRFYDDTAFSEIVRQFVVLEQKLRNAKTGLFYQWNEKTIEHKSANKHAGGIQEVSTTAMGWFGMALVDVLESIPENHPQKDTLVNILNRFATALVKYRNKKTGLWTDISITKTEEKNDLATTASSMLVYALAKGARLGALPSRYLNTAKTAYSAILTNFVRTENRQVNFRSTVGIATTGGTFAADAINDALMKQKVISDPKEVGAFLLASNEIEIIPTRAVGKNKLVLLDYYFNRETRKDITGKTVQWHYVWDEMDNLGFSLLGEVFKQNGAIINSLSEAPTYENLSAASVYIIVDPDTERENSNPNYMQPQYVKTIHNWVKEGGVLALFLNDSVNAEFHHFNTLAEKFGIHFNQDNINKVRGNNYEEGAILIPPNHSIFKTARKAFIKELSTLKVSAPAKSVLKKDGHDLIAVAKIGHGFVFAVGDPWLYNEYTDGRKLPRDFDNYKAAQDLVRWTLTVKTNKHDIIKWNTAKTKRKKRK